MAVDLLATSKSERDLCPKMRLVSSPLGSDLPVLKYVTESNCIP